MYKIKHVKIGDIFGVLYLPSRISTKGIIWAKGGPSLGDVGKSRFWMPALKHNYILFIPDYIGHCRSDGKFNFRNCIKTLEISEDFLSGKLNGIDINTNLNVKIECKSMLLIGSSWGGAIIPFYEKYKKSKIKTLGLFKPVTDWGSQGKTRYKEENVQKTAIQISTIWKHIYRGFSSSKWPKIFTGSLPEYDPIKNIDSVSGKNIYICHGKKDTSINWKKSKYYYDKLKGKNANMVKFRLFANEGHSEELNEKSLSFMLNDLKDSYIMDK